MKINTNQILKKITGENYKENEGKDNEKDFTFGNAVGAIMVIQKSENPWKQYRLTKEIAESEGELNLSSEDIVFVKKILEQHAQSQNAIYYPFVIGQCIDLLEGAKDAKPKKGE